MAVYHQVEHCFHVLSIITREFLALDLKARNGEAVPRQLDRMGRLAQFFMDFPLMNYTEEEARLIRNKALLERRSHHE